MVLERESGLRGVKEWNSFDKLQLVVERDKLKFVGQVLFQTFNEYRVVNPFAANEGETASIQGHCKILNFFVAQIPH